MSGLTSPFNDPERPLLMLDYLVEWVGPRTVTAERLAAILTHEMLAALGEPKVWVQSPSDSTWRRWSPRDVAVTFDSVSLGWRMLRGEQRLTGDSARQLLERCESLAHAVERRAIPLPLPDEVDARIGALLQLRDQADVGINLYVNPLRQGFRQPDVAKIVEPRGYRLQPGGTYDYREASWNHALVSVGSLNDHFRGPDEPSYNLLTHEGLHLGFPLPPAPAALAQFDLAVETGLELALELGGWLGDEEDRPLEPALRTHLRDQLQSSLTALAQTGVAPGSREALALFLGDA